MTFTKSEIPDTNDEQVTLQYVRVQDAILWDDNSKLHDIGALVTSIEEHGFRDPPTWDSTLGAIVEGNGRTTALQMMEKQERKRPRGIIKDADDNWCMPVLFGVDASSRAAAERYGIDHNNLTMLGGDFTIWDVSRMWDRDKYKKTLQRLSETGDMPVSVDYEDFTLLQDADLKTVSEIDEQDELPQQPGKSEPVLVITVGNFNLIDDVMEAVEMLLDSTPGWDAQVTKN